MESKIKNIIKEQKGITLVALVVTIVILIILAVISINVIFGENGLITKAQEGKKEHEKAEARERLEVVLADAYAEKKVSNEYTEEEFLRDHLDEYIYDQEPEAEVNGEEISLNGYTFELDRSVPELGRFVGQNDNLPPAIRVLNKTTKSINVEIIRAEGVNKFKYSYKKLNEDQFSDVVEKSENLFTFENLDANNIYVLKVEMEKNGEVFTIDKTVTLGEIPKGAIELKSVTWENGEASIVIITKENNYQIEWQVNGIEDSKWTKESEGEKEVTINGLRHNSMVYVRLFDGVSSGEYASISVKDVIKPQNANIVINSENIILKQTIEATITHLDNESDVSIQESKWVCNTKSNKIGTNPDLYTGGVSKQNPEKISFVLPQLGEYYLNVLTVDNAGNKTETVSEPIVPLQFTYSIDLSNQNLKMNPEDCFVNDKTDMSEDEKLILNKINKDISGTYERIFTEENNKEYIALVKNNTEVYKNYFMYDKNSIKKVTKYKDSGWILYDSDPQG